MILRNPIGIITYACFIIYTNKLKNYNTQWSCLNLNLHYFTVVNNINYTTLNTKCSFTVYCTIHW